MCYIVVWEAQNTTINLDREMYIKMMHEIVGIVTNDKSRY